MNKSDICSGSLLLMIWVGVLPAPIEWLGSRRIKSAVAENLTKLKHLLEEGRVVLQDGRQARL